MASVEERVIDIVAEQLGVSKDQITRETSFVNDLGADSLDTVELVMELEEEFDINIPDDAAEKIQTVGQAIDHIEKAVEDRQTGTDFLTSFHETPRRHHGLGVVTSLSCKVEDLWTRLCNGESGIRRIETLRHGSLPREVRRGNHRLVHRGLRRAPGGQAAGSLHPVRPGRRHRRGPRLGPGFLPGGSHPLRRDPRLGDRRPGRDRDPTYPAPGEGTRQGLRLHHPQADGQRRQRPGVDPVRTARPELRRGSRPAPAPPTPSATPCGRSSTAMPT